MVTKGGGLPDPIEPKPKPKPWPPIEPVPVEYPVIPTTTIKRSVQRSRMEGNVVRQTTIRGSRIATGRNARVRSLALKESLGLDDTRVCVTVDGLVEMSDDLSAVDIKAKYVLAPLNNGMFKLVSVVVPEGVEAGETDMIANQVIYTTKSIEATVRTIEGKKMVAAELVAAREVSEVSI